MDGPVRSLRALPDDCWGDRMKHPGSKRYKRWLHNNLILHQLRLAMYDSGEELTDLEDLPKIPVGPEKGEPSLFELLVKDPAALECFLMREEGPIGTRRPLDPMQKWLREVRREFKPFRGWIPTTFMTSLEQIVRRRWSLFGPIEVLWEDEELRPAPCSAQGHKILLIRGLPARLRRVTHSWCSVMGLHSETDRESNLLKIYPPHSDEDLLDLSVAKTLAALANKKMINKKRERNVAQDEALL